MSTRIDAPTAFISYSWSSAAHEQKVEELAQRLMSDGVNVILDKWYLKEGHDKYAFMEKSVNDPAVKKVLMICDRKYAEKANSKAGGVGTETQIISPEIYTQVDQEKFIPVIFELDEKGKPYLPTFLKSRMYIDLSREDRIHEGYEKLLRSIYGKPASIKPVLGTPPSYITDDEPVIVRTLHKFATFKDAITHEKATAKRAAADYLETLLDAMEDFRLEVSGEVPFDEKVDKSIRDFKPYRDEFVEFVKLVSQSSTDPFYFEEIHEFLQRALSFKYPPKLPDGVGSVSYYEHQFDNYVFILRELFLYLIATLINNRNYDGADFFLSQRYYFSKHTGRESKPYAIFDGYNRTLEDARKKRLQLNRVSVVADMVKELADLKSVSFDDVMQADLILFLRGILNSDERHGEDWWFPQTLVYASRFSEGQFDLFFRAESKRYFEAVKKLLNVSSKADLEQRFDKAQLNHGLDKMMFGHWSIPWRKYMNLKNLDTH